MIGVDLVHIPSFMEKVASQEVKDKLFSQAEQQHGVQTLAGMFAAKEAFVKASGTEPEWIMIQVIHTSDGKPHIQHPDYADDQIMVSISHEKEYACGMVMIDENRK